MRASLLPTLLSALAACAASATASAQYPSYGNSYPSARTGDVVRCESSHDRPRRCDIDSRTGVNLVRQLSDSPCIRGQTWDVDERGLWVTHGCGGEFAAGMGYGRAGQVIRCESPDNRYRQCSGDVRGGARIARQLSNQPCVEGRTWGANRSGIWVDQGCRADFEVGFNGNNGWAWGNNQGYNPRYNGSGGRSVRCESNDGRTHRCNVATQGVRLQRQVSDARCQQGQTWGWDRGGIWVSGGCRADFSVW